MYERDRNRSLSHARRNALHRAVANVAHDKNAWNVGFQKPRLPIELPAVWPLAFAFELRAGIDETTLIAFHNVCKPVRIRRCSDHDEECVGWYFVYLVRFCTVNRNGFQVSVAVCFHD